MAESRIDWGNPSDAKFPAKIKAWDEGYALGMKRSDAKVAALRAMLEGVDDYLGHVEAGTNSVRPRVLQEQIRSVLR